MKLCIAGKNQIAVDVLTAASQRFDTMCLPNSSDTGADDWQPSLRRVATELGVPIVPLDGLFPLENLCFLSLEFAEIIRPCHFATDRLFNLHFSLLPNYRGCNTSAWPILNGESRHGVTLHWIDEGVDTGPIIDQRSFPLLGLTSYEAYMICQRLGTELALSWLDRLIDGQVPAQPQGSGTTYRRSDLDFGQRSLDLSETAEHLMRKVRAFTFPPYQRPTLHGADVLDASLEARQGYQPHATGDGTIWLRF